MGVRQSNGLFGWCLPDMGLDQHEACRTSFMDQNNVEIKCKCVCHEDWTAYAKSKKKGSKTNGKQQRKSTNR